MDTNRVLQQQNSVWPYREQSGKHLEQTGGENNKIFFS